MAKVPKKQTILFVGKYVVLAGVIGFFVGATKSVIFESTDSGKYAKYKVCDEWESDVRGENCLYGHTEYSTLGDRAKQSGWEWAWLFAIAGLFVGVGLKDKYNSEEMAKQIEEWEKNNKT